MTVSLVVTTGEAVARCREASVRDPIRRKLSFIRDESSAGR